MSNKSGIAGGVISLPKGGGALQGIGEKFAPDLHTGTGNFTVPIAVPSGRNGFQPQLSLVYSTGQGNGPFGLGWSLSVPGVSRKTSRGIPRYRDETSDAADHDTFILSGAEDLVPVAGGRQERRRYRPRTEGLFACIERYRHVGDDLWEVRSKDGLVSLYGTRGSAGNDPAVVADPGNRDKVFAWKLTETRDPFENRIEYEYLRDLAENGPRRWDQLYLRQVRYADYLHAGKTEFLISVTFEYGDPDVHENRPDPFSDYRAGFEIRTRKRCTKIVVRTHAERERLVREYRLIYLDQQPATGDLRPPNRASMLTRIEVVGHGDDGATASLPPLEFGYTPFAPDKPENRGFHALQGKGLPARSLASPDLELVDLFGNGLPDILEMNGSARYWRNLGGGRFALPREMREVPAGLSLADPGVQLIDANGDGRADLLVTTGPLSGYYPLQFGGLWDHGSFRRFEVAPSFSLEDPEVKLVDLDGDGLTDVIRSGSSFEIFFNRPARDRPGEWGWNATRRVERGQLEAFPNANFSDPRVKWGDMSGDGLQDIVLIHDADIAYWPNLGHGDWGPRVTMRNCPRFPHGYDPRRILIGDVDGDGLADVVYVDDGRVMLWINQSGNRWSDPIVIHGTPPVTEVDAVRLADMHGTGVSGILWSADARGPSMYFLDLTGGAKPYLLSRMDNNAGAVTEVEYSPSTRFYLEDEARPDARWKTRLPFPVQVVSRVKVKDHFSRSERTTRYQYHHGYWDGVEREFRGFGMVEQLDAEVFEASADHHHSPPTLTKTWFHQGAVEDTAQRWGTKWTESEFGEEFWQGDPGLLAPTHIDAELRPHEERDVLRALRGRVLRTELYALDGTERQSRPYTVTESSYACREEDPPGPNESDRLRIFFPHTLAQRTTQWERGDDPLTQVTFTGDYDDYGQPRQQVTVSLPRRSLKRESVTGAIVGEIEPDQTDILATCTRTLYARPEADHDVHDRVAQVHTFELAQPGGVAEENPADLGEVLKDQIRSAKEISEQFRVALRGWDDDQPLPASLRLIGHTINRYDGDAFEGLPVGQAGSHGALTHSETLVFSDDELDLAYSDRRPTYLGGSAEPPAGAPPGFGANLGYRVVQPAGAPERHYADVQRQKFDFQDAGSTEGRGLVVATRDPFGQVTTIAPDRYWLMPAVVSDPVGLETKADYDYRVMQPSCLTDPNGHQTHFRYTALGLLQKQFLVGRDGEGGSEEKPDVEFEYDFVAYQRAQPISVRTRQRVWHASDGVSDETIDSWEYSDGFGRLIQKRAQAEELAFGERGDDVGLGPEPGQALGSATPRWVADHWVVSGWQVYNNKGRVVEKYEPFFATGHAYQAEAEAKRGQHATLYYDPRGQLIRTVNPDGSEQRVLFGVPRDLQDPDEFEPTPWETFTYDANDLAPLSYDLTEKLPDGTPKPLIDRAPAAHHCTPTSSVIDALGRVICQIERNGHAPADDWFITRSAYDVRGNLLEVRDALGRTAFAYAYDLRNERLRVDSIDAGLRTSVLDAAGNLVETRDSKGSIGLRGYDAVNRLTHLWARNSADAPVTVRERLEYADGGDPDQPAAKREAQRSANRLGRLWRHKDEAGLLEFDRYDFKGNVAEKTRRVIGDDALAHGWTADWSASGAEDALDPRHYQTTTSFDALNRPVEILYPEDVDGRRAKLEPKYNRAGALEAVALDGQPYVAQIAYNARGQRILIAHGNGVMTRYAYDTRSFRLTRLRSERYELRAREPDTPTWQAELPPLQELTYRYDLAGNITSIEDRTPNCGVANSSHGRDRLVRQFAYDPLHRLTEATGRGCRNIGMPRSLQGLRRCGSYSGGQPMPDQTNGPELTELYTETYAYDGVGNLLALGYRAPSGAWTRTFQFEVGVPHNRLRGLTQDGETHSFAYDDNGNMRRQNTERWYEWDHADRMTAFAIRPESSANTSVEARYLYGADGMRVKKWVRKKGSDDAESMTYVDSVFEHCRWKEGSAAKENNLLHVMDDQRRIAIIRRGSPAPGDAGPPVQHQLGDHLGSSSVVLDASGEWINSEEYFPYGETSFGGFSRKRYRFSGTERDEESGLTYHGARYYAPCFARWLTPDPAESSDSTSLYAYARCNPPNFVDVSGEQAGAPNSASARQGGSAYLDPESARSTIAVCGASRQMPESRNTAQEVSHNVEALSLNLTTRALDIADIADITRGIPTLRFVGLSAGNLVLGALSFASLGEGRAAKIIGLAGNVGSTSLTAASVAVGAGGSFAVASVGLGSYTATQGFLDLVFEDWRMWMANMDWLVQLNAYGKPYYYDPDPVFLAELNNRVETAKERFNLINSPEFRDEQSRWRQHLAEGRPVDQEVWLADPKFFPNTVTIPVETRNGRVSVIYGWPAHGVPKTGEVIVGIMPWR